ncbi:MAG: bifunctional glutamate N-acetyltransferase/amino-acid acetyltransferase ArgJ [Oceanicoccus sp.]|uniref:bifunctional glutamate N-acetyltransferase/amino-acid acetyltransferase ArgJ n=1 Tax=Oceanicoccus sp. TaxID=2691044 RepID=UPI00260DE5BD|nr:bifunctional glutamate N-acetyltransferase/amino-acid acetyltransferase ArgJ [Oceanicoccus sp.]MCP3906667.1 bifunctional glutamate N-acetyltransferase/amino-acid acetyltransferase ArgJ [Oceanicoccus sp.]
MAVGEGKLPPLYPVNGFRLGTTSAGIKTQGRQDLVLMEIAEGASVAGVFTRNAFCAAPVQQAKKHLTAATPRYFIVNTGNANAGTGEQGLQDSQATCEAVAAQASVSGDQVLPFSTGVIGEPLPIDKIIAALPAAQTALDSDGWEQAASGIMTTDTRPKAASVQIDLLGETVTITGIAKGAGMIKPNMATMLAYVATDAAIDQSLLQLMINQAVNQSFNRITVDGDTSTNDACMLVATGQASAERISDQQHPFYQTLQDAITTVFIELAQGLVRDGEGANKFVTVAVSGGQSEEECLKVAYTVAESPLVKTALFASDPNWGRLLAAIGRAGIDTMDVDRVSVHLNDVLIAENGCRAASYTEEQGSAAMEPEEIVIAIDLDRGDKTATVWTSDLSHDYVRINAEYRT